MTKKQSNKNTGLPEGLKYIEAKLSEDITELLNNVNDKEEQLYLLGSINSRLEMILLYEFDQNKNLEKRVSVTFKR